MHLSRKIRKLIAYQQIFYPDTGINHEQKQTKIETLFFL